MITLSDQSSNVIDTFINYIKQILYRYTDTSNINRVKKMTSSQESDDINIRKQR